MNFLLASATALLSSGVISDEYALLVKYHDTKVIKFKEGNENEKTNGVKLHFFGPKNLWKSGAGLDLKTPYRPSFYISIYITPEMYNFWDLMFEHRYIRRSNPTKIEEFERRFFFGDSKYMRKNYEEWLAVWEDMSKVQKQVDKYFAQLKFESSTVRKIREYTPNIKEILSSYWLETETGWATLRDYFRLESLDNNFLWYKQKAFHNDPNLMKRELREEGAVLQIGVYNCSFYREPGDHVILGEESDWRKRWKDKPIWAVNNWSVRITPWTVHDEPLLYYYDDVRVVVGHALKTFIKETPCFYLPIVSRETPKEYPFKKFIPEQIYSVIGKQFNVSLSQTNHLKLDIDPNYKEFQLYSGGPISNLVPACYCSVVFWYSNPKTGDNFELGSTHLGFKFFDSHISG